MHIYLFIYFTRFFFFNKNQLNFAEAQMFLIFSEKLC